MSSLHCVVHPLPGTEDQLNDRLKELGTRINCSGCQGVPSIANLQINIQEVVVGPSHIALLTEDGRVGRLVYSINTDGLDLNKMEQSKGSSSKTASQSNSKLTARMSTSGRRIVRTTSSSAVRGGRPTAGVIMGAPPLLPAQYVPDELVSQAQVVLQGKSRNLIIRELQRTNLDVNQAVNNLLSRDDEDVEEQEEADSYAPDDLISLLDANISVASDHPSVIIDAEAMFPEDMFGYSTVRSRPSSCRRQPERERDSSATLPVSTARQESGELRWRDLQYTGDLNKKKDNVLPDAVDVEHGIHWWPDKSNGPSNLRFSHIACLHSELVAVSTTGQIHQWRWADREPYVHAENPNIFHPKAHSLGLAAEKVVAISAAIVRCSVATESGKVATWVDEALSDVSSKLEQPAQQFPELQNDKILSLHTCQLYTCAWCESGALFWWGVLPFNQRKRLWEKFKGKPRKPRPEISEGAQVGMRASPMYNPGALAFCMSGGVPKIGQLMNAAWSLSEGCRFKILPPSGNWSSSSASNLPNSSGGTEKRSGSEPPVSKIMKIGDSKDSSASDKLDMPPPPSPASSTCSDTGSISSPATYKRGKRALPKDEDRFDEEEWPLKEVIFVEDTRPVPIGEVLAVDGDQVVVVPTNKEAKSNLRVFHKNQLQVIRNSGSPRVPDCYQRSPKKVPVSQSGQILAVAVDGRGVHAIVKNGSKVSYIIYNLSTGKLGQECSLPTESGAFLGCDSSAISLVIAGESEHVGVLRDGNSTIYPLSKDCTNAFKDPTWPDLPPVSCLAVGTHFLHSAGPHQKNHVAFLVLAVKRQTLMPKILKCDLQGVKQVLAAIESGQTSVDKVVEEKSDGNHNILHACVSACTLVASKDAESDNPFDKDARLNSVSPWMDPNDVMNVVGNVEENLLTPSSSKNTPGPSMPSLTVTDPNERKTVLLSILKNITDNVSLRCHLRTLLMARDSNGLTPFMLAVTRRAYTAALALLDTITQLASEYSMDSDGEKRAIAQMVFPRGSSPDDSPLHIICYNDTCSFTWTGDQHINQDIFECKTCGLTGSLCCCTECARVCHKGHDCKLKHTSPTAYCDCWQKCKCKSLRTGHQVARFELLSRLATDTELVNHPNGRGENILLYLIQTVRRQVKEQKQYPSRFRSCMNPRKSNVNDADLEMPDHNLDPPKFSRKALERLLKDWNSVRAMILTGHKDDSGVNLSANESSPFMHYQGHSSYLDKFVYALLVKLSVFHQDDKSLKHKHMTSGEEEERRAISDTLISTLLATFQKELHNDTIPGRRQEAIKVARRFVAATVRVFIILGIEVAPQTARKKGLPQSSPFTYCVKVLESLLPLAICELCEAADALLMPVRLNFVKPTAPFPLTNVHLEGIISCNEMFDAEPVQSQANRGNDASTSSNDHNEVSAEDGPIASSNFSASVSARQLNRQRDTLAQSDDQDIDASSEREEGHERSENEGGAEGGESDMELDLLASDSDSDDNQSGVDNASAQRSVQTGATAGSDAEEESPDSSGAEDEDEQSEAAETDEFDSGDMFSDELLERRVNASIPNRNSAPNHLQWAIRSREATRSVQGQSGSGLASPGIYIDPPSMRRGPACAAVASAQEPVSLSTTNNTLARAFTIVIKQLSSLLGMACDAAKNGSRSATISEQNLTPAIVIALLRHSDAKLQPTWDWVLNVMDTTESQLRFGRELNQIIEGAGGSTSTHTATSTPTLVTGMMAGPPTTASSHSNVLAGTSSLQQSVASIRSVSRGGQSVAPSSSSNNPPATSSGRINLSFIRDPILQRCQSTRRSTRTLSTVTAESNGARREALSYVVSLLRAHKNEHCDSLPDIDVGSLKHLAYAFDALMFYLRSCESGVSTLEVPAGYSVSKDVVWDTDENENDDEMEEAPSMMATAPPASESVDEDSNQSSSLGSRGRKHTFFQRSNSTLCLGSVGVDVFAKPFQEVLPLADKPHLLQPEARREELFGFPKSHTHNVAGGKDAPLNAPLRHLGLMDNQQRGGCYVPPLDDSFYVQLFTSTDYLQQQQPTDLSASAFSGSTNPPPYKNDCYSYERERVPIIVAPRRPHQGGYDPSVAYAGESVSPVRLGVKSVIVRVGASSTSIPPPPPYSSSLASSSTVFKGESKAVPENDVIMESPEARRNTEDTKEQLRPALIRSGVTQDMLLGRWRLTVELYGRVFIEDVGTEPGSLIAMLGGFPIKEAKFRRDMEKLRNSQQKDLQISKVERDRGLIISQTFKELNTHFNNNNRRPSANNPPLVVNRVKVTFKDEPGEGSGVARSFYTAISEAILSNEKLPSLESCQVGLSVVRYSLYGQYKGRDRDRRPAALAGRSLQRRDSKKSLSVDARPYYGAPDPIPSDNAPTNLHQMGKTLFPKIQLLKPSLANKITGMLLELTQPQLILLSASESALRIKVDEAVDLILSQDQNNTPEASPQDVDEGTDDQEEVCAPLFYQPGKRGFYSPRQAKATAERLNAFRNVGRLIGLCLLQNELCPIYLNRHVLKFILGRNIRFHDLAFFDPVVYESLRKVVLDAETKESGLNELKALDLNFSIDLITEEGGTTVDLITGGRNVEVSIANLYDYVRKYAEHRMVKCQHKALQNLKDGVFDVIPSTALDSLTSEDLRLLLNGVGDINVSTLISYTTFNDESASNGIMLQRFKRWLWSIVEKMTSQERQDLVYFWTGSPALPASEEGFQPIPSVTIRPADDTHLPTANTCISRLYIPLYSSRVILRSKILLAIKTKNFGFV